MFVRAFLKLLSHFEKSPDKHVRAFYHEEHSGAFSPQCTTEAPLDQVSRIHTVGSEGLFAETLPAEEPQQHVARPKEEEREQDHEQQGK